MDSIHVKRRQLVISRVVTALLFVFLGFLPACNKPQHAEAGLAFRDWYIATPMGNGTMSVAYGVIENQNAAERHLVAVSLSCADSVEMHETTAAAGRVSMRALPSVVIGANEKVRFAPAGKHLMVFGLRQNEDCKIQFTLGAETPTFAIPIRARELK